MSDKHRVNYGCVFISVGLWTSACLRQSCDTLKKERKVVNTVLRGLNHCPHKRFNYDSLGVDSVNRDLIQFSLVQCKVFF